MHSQLDNRFGVFSESSVTPGASDDAKQQHRLRSRQRWRKFGYTIFVYLLEENGCFNRPDYSPRDSVMLAPLWESMQKIAYLQS